MKTMDETTISISAVPELETDLEPHYEETVKAPLDDYLTRRGVTHFQKYVINEVMADRWRGLRWFRQQLSKYYKELEDEDYWDHIFLTDPNGNSIKNIRFFQLYLLLANSFREHLFKLRPKSFIIG